MYYTKEFVDYPDFALGRKVSGAPIPLDLETINDIFV